MLIQKKTVYKFASASKVTVHTYGSILLHGAQNIVYIFATTLCAASTQILMGIVIYILNIM